MLVLRRTAVQALSSRAGRTVRFVWRYVTVAVALFPLLTQAHHGTGLAGGVVARLFHSLSGLDHMLAMVAVGRWDAFLGPRLLCILPMLFPMMMVVRAGSGIRGLPLPPVQFGIALSVITLGGLILFAVRNPVAIVCLVVGMSALFHAYAHGAESPSAMGPVGYSAGAVLGTGALRLLGIALGTLRSRSTGAMLLRGGAVIMAMDGGFLSSAVSA